MARQARRIGLAALLPLVFLAQASAAGQPPAPASRWAWLGAGDGTYWYVPTAYLPAYRWSTDDPAGATQASDQTVWHLQRFANGYVFGAVAAQLDDGAPQCQAVIGSVTPDGRVYLTFNATGGKGPPALTTGVGAMVRSGKGWAFEMQMASGNDRLQVTHWARMMQCRPGEACWTALPGLTSTSLPDFLAQCDAG